MKIHDVTLNIDNAGDCQCEMVMLGDALKLQAEVDRLKIDEKRLDWLLTGDGSMTIDIDSSLDWCGSRDAIDEAMQAEQEQRRLEGKTYFKPCGMMCNPDGTRSIFDDVDDSF